MSAEHARGRFVVDDQNAETARPLNVLLTRAVLTAMAQSDLGCTRGRILVIDDDLPLQRVIERAASRVGLDTVPAEDGEVGLAHLQKESFDLIILDIGLPGMDGRDVLHRLKASARTTNIPTLVYSGRCNQYDRASLYRLGAENLIEKPFGADALMRRVVRAIGKRSRPPSSPIEQSVSGALENGNGATFASVAFDDENDHTPFELRRPRR